MVSEHASPLASLGGVDAGGQNVHVEALAATLARFGHEVTVFTRRDSPALPERVTMRSGVIVRHVTAGPAKRIAKDAIFAHVPEFAGRLREAWAAELPDVVHSHFWMSALASLPGAKEFGIPLVHTFHALGIEKRRLQGDADTSPCSRIEDEARIAREADRIIATSTSEMFELVRMGARRGLKVVPCGVDLEHFRPSLTHRTAGPHVRAVALSRLVPRKGIASIVEALAEVPNIELVIAGGGDLRNLDRDPEVCRLRRLALGKGVADRVTFVGRTPRAGVPALLRSADVVVCTPWYEPFGIVPLEAMACGIPLIVSAVGGLVDTVVDGVTGIHVPPRDPAALARALDFMQRCPDVRHEMGRLGAERVATRYSWLRVATDTVEVYREAIGLGPTEFFGAAGA